MQWPGLLFQDPLEAGAMDPHLSDKHANAKSCSQTAHRNVDVFYFRGPLTAGGSVALPALGPAGGPKQTISLSGARYTSAPSIAPRMASPCLRQNRLPLSRLRAHGSHPFLVPPRGSNAWQVFTDCGGAIVDFTNDRNELGTPMLQKKSPGSSPGLVTLFYVG
jgi:hypothetical protein